MFSDFSGRKTIMRFNAISVKFFIYILIAFIFLFLAFTMYEYINLRKTQTAQLNAEIQRVVALIPVLIESPLYNYNTDEINTILSSFLGTPEIISLSVMDEFEKPLSAREKNITEISEKTIRSLSGFAEADLAAFFVSTTKGVYSFVPAISVETLPEYLRPLWNSTLLQDPERKKGLVVEKKADIIRSDKKIGSVSMSFSEYPAMREIKRSFQTTIIKNFLIAAAILLFNSFLLTLIVTNPLKKITGAFRDVAEGEGDLTREINIRSNFELEQLATYFNRFIAKLLGIVLKLKEISNKGSELGIELSANTEEVSATVNEISATVTSLKQKTEHLNSQSNKADESNNRLKEIMEKTLVQINNQTDHVDQSSSVIEEMIASIQSISKIAEEKKGTSDHLALIAGKGVEDMNRMKDSIGRIATTAENITEMITVINNVSEKTNLLAMNAAIEAAHAGDYGKGFSVVADEIRKLAETTTEQVREISSTLSNIIGNINGATDISTTTAETIGSIITDIRDVTQSITEMQIGIKEISTGTEQITKSIKELNKTTMQVKDSSQNVDTQFNTIKDVIGNITQLVSENLTGMSEIDQAVSDISKAMVSLSQLGQVNSKNLMMLNSEIGRFKTEGGNVPSDQSGIVPVG